MNDIVNLDIEIGEYEVYEDIYVQGAEIVNKKMLMSSGQWGKSFIGFFENGRVLNKLRLEDEYFAEGLTFFNDLVYLLTYKEGKVFTYTIDGNELIKNDLEFSIDQEGWGLTHNDKHIIMSDGTDKVYFRDPDTFEIIDSIDITLDGEPVDRINELEYAKEYIYANQWKSHYIYKIDPKNGNIVESYYLPKIATKSDNIIDDEGNRDPNAFLNGIAHIKDDRFFVFGKNFEHYYVMDLK